jgi:beta-phosphoglucomutase-like phosphatase (HAD superfamily)
MNKAFIFDFDGIIVDSEPIWLIEEEVIYTQLYGNKIYNKLGSIIGLNMEAIHHKTIQLGSTVSKEDLFRAFRERAPEVYRNARLTPGIQELKDELTQRDFHLGIVSASPQEWIDIVLHRLNWNPADFKIILSIQDRSDIAHKPSPDGYIYAMQELGATPATTLILEDSNPGIASAKASGATVIGFKANLIKDYIQKGADRYAENVEEVINIVKGFKPNYES